MNASLHCSPSSAFSAPNYDNYCESYSVERASQHGYEVPMSYCSYDQRYGVASSAPTYLDGYPSSYSSLYGASQHTSNAYSLLPFPFLHECGTEPGFIRKRNERERLRVRNVNDGYARLREHLPLEPTEKRLSKVETLRAAIKYIKYLQEILKEKDASDKVRIKENIKRDKTQGRQEASKGD